jgi:spore coat protein A
MKFNVVAPSGADLPLTLTQNWVPGIDPLLATFNLDGSFTPLVPVTRTRTLTLNESFDAYGRLTQMMGTDVAVTPGKFGRPYMSAPTEQPANGDVEIWEFLNLTGDTHPIHIHLSNAQILNRQLFDAVNYNGGEPTLTGPIILPNPTELGWKETIPMHPGTVTRIIMKFDLAPSRITGPDHNPIDLTSKGGDAQGNPPPSPRTGGAEYVYHCHILEHEEHDMMRPLVVT